MVDERERFLLRQGVVLRKLDAQIRELEVDAQVARDAAKASASDAIDEVKRKRADINYRLNAIAQNGSSAWKDIKRVVTESKRDIERIVHRSRSKIKQA